jgi:hypothetical protein
MLILAPKVKHILLFWKAFIQGKGSLDNLDNGFSNKYKKILKIEKKNLRICSSTYRLMVVQISYNFIIV